MKVLTTFKRALIAVALMIPIGNSSWGQTYNFEESCGTPANSFYAGCIPNWFSTSGTPDNQGVPWTPYQGSKFAHMYAKWDGTCGTTPATAEGIALNYSFQAGKTYRITYYAIGTVSNPVVDTYTSNWVLTNGLINRMGAMCTAGEIPPVTPAGSEIYAGPNFTNTSWTLNQQILTPSANFSQLWFRHKLTSTVMNLAVMHDMAIDAFKIEEICLPTPAISGLSAFCAGSPISFTGSITNGCSITKNVWTVVESDQYGNAVAGTTEWWSPWADGTPGTLNIPSVANGGPSMTCGKYYRIKLAVQNAYTSWTETIKIVYINCPPSFRLKGSTSNICWGETAMLIPTLNSGNPANYSMTCVPVSPAGPGIYSGPMASLVATPTVSTTYLVTVTDNITGCSTSVQWTVTVQNNDPGFAITTNSTNPAYLQATATPNIPSGQPAGFGYMWFIDELDGSGNTVYSVNSNSIAPCWWPGLGASTTFPGFDGLTQTYSTSCTPANGKFKYNTNYRITRGTWSDDCPWTQVSYILVYVKSGEWVFEEDHNAPDMSSALSVPGKQIELLLSPNPANDKVKISTNSAIAGELRVTDLSGRVVFSTQLKAGENSIELSVDTYSPGTYLVQVVGDNNIQSTQKLIISE